MRKEAEAAHRAELKRLRAARAAEVRQLKAEDAHAERIARARMSVGCVRVPWDLRVFAFLNLLRRQRHTNRVAPNERHGGREAAAVLSRCYDLIL